MERHFFCFCLPLALAVGLLLPARGAWHDADAEFRKEVKVDGEGGAPVTATTTVFLDDRFAGFTLTDAQGAARPFGLLNRAGSLCAIHFDAKAGEPLSLYFSTAAALPPPGLEHLSGLRHLVKSYDGREVTSSAQFAELWKAGEFLGGEFVDQVYSAFNPFGPNAKALHQYDGILLIEKGGESQFCLASTDASFLAIDGREVAAWPGKHPVKDGLEGKIRGSAQLTPGPHRFTFLHANGGNDSFAIAAWVPPGEKKHFVIGPEAFTRAAYAFIGPLTRKDGQRQADFIWDNRYMVNIADHGLYQLAFEAAPFKDAPDAAFEWDFGDGTRGSGLKAEHLYFTRGDPTVTLTATLGNGQKSACRQTVRVLPRYGQSENDDARALALLDQAVRQEQEPGIQPQGYALISAGYFFFLQEEKADAFAARVLAAADRIPEADLNALMIQLALGVQQVDEHYELSEKCFRVILEKVKDPAARAFAALHLGGMLNLCLNRPADAREVLATVERKALGDADQRLLDIYLADTALILDDCATARKSYAAIAKPATLVTGKVLDRTAVFDYNSRYFRLQNLLSQRLYRESLSELDLLEWEIPEERLSPRMNLLKVQALAGNKQPRKAVVCLQRALLAEVDDTYRPKLRLELATLYAGLNQFVQAKHQVSLIRKETPWTQEEIDARKLLTEIDKKIEEAGQ
jgi:hypothetical protein